MAHPVKAKATKSGHLPLMSPVPHGRKGKLIPPSCPLISACVSSTHMPPRFTIVPGISPENSSLPSAANLKRCPQEQMLPLGPQERKVLAKPTLPIHQAQDRKFLGGTSEVGPSREDLPP